jgi:hypothetical protein
VSDDRPASTTPEPQPGGRCLKCGALVALADTFKPGEENGQGQRLHRIGTDRKNPIGEVCGPVATALVFHVIAHAIINGQPAVMRRKMLSLQAPEENYDAVVTQWEAAIRSTFKAVAKEGGQLVGVEPPPVVVSSWAQIGALL